MRLGVAVDPIAGAARLGGRAGRFLLHSASDADGLGGWSFAGCDPDEALEVRGDAITWWRGGTEEQVGGDPFDAIERFCAAHGVDLRAPDGAAPEPKPRVIGWLGYELGRAPRGDGPADLWLGAYAAIARWQSGDDRPELIGDGARVAAAGARRR